MESLDSIKNSCQGALSSFHTVLKEQLRKEISTTYSFIPLYQVLWFFMFIRRGHESSYAG